MPIILSDLIHVFDALGWRYLTLPQHDLLLTSFRSPHGSADLALRPVLDGQAVLLEAVGLGQVPAEQVGELLALAWQWPGIAAARDPEDGEVRLRLLLPVGQGALSPEALRTAVEALLAAVEALRQTLSRAAEARARAGAEEPAGQEGASEEGAGPALHGTGEGPGASPEAAAALQRAQELLEGLSRAEDQAAYLRDHLDQFDAEVLAALMAAAQTAQEQVQKGNGLYRARRLEEAEGAYREAEGLYRRLAKVHPEAYEPDLAATLNNLGVVLRDRRRLEEAEGAYREAEGLYRRLAKAHPEAYEPDLAMTLNNLGVVLSDRRRLEEAEGAYREAEGLYRRLAKAHPEAYEPNLAATLNNLGNVLSDRRRLEEAEGAYREAEALDRHNLGRTRWRVLWNLGRLQRDQGHLTQAYPSLSAALEELEAMRRGLRWRTDRLAFQAEHAPLYTEMVSLCLEMDQPAEAWHWAERGKGRTLLDLLGSARPRLDSPEKRVTFEEWQRLEQEAFRLEEELDRLRRGANGHGPARGTPAGPEPALPPAERTAEIRRLKEELLRTRAEERRLRQEVARLLEEGRALVQVEVPPALELALALRELARGPRPLLVEYFLLGGDRYAVFLLPLWEVAKDRPLPLRACPVSLPEGTLGQVLGLFGAGLGAARVGFAGRYRGDPPAEAEGLSQAEKEDARRQALESFAALPAALGRALLEPWADALAELRPSELIVVPESFLHLLPLHTALWDGQPLIERYPMAYLANAAMAHTLVRRRQEAPQVAGRLVMGPPSSDLPAAQVETQELAELWGVRPAGQPYALERMRVEVLRGHARQMAQAHLATHSTFDFEDCLRSRIAFHQEWLTLDRLISDESLDFHGMRLFYLSSCEAGLARAEAGDELQGLAWAVIYAGARAVMASLWPVHDRAALRMAQRFYYHVHQGLPLAQAYAQAVRDLRAPRFGGEQADNPYYWAPFVLYGDGWG